MNNSPVSLAQKWVSIILLISMILGQFTAVAAMPAAAPSSTHSQAKLQITENANAALFRTHVTLRQPNDLHRIEAMGAVVLESGDDWALLLVASSQLETLARLRFQPQATDSLDSLAQSEESPSWLQRSMQPTLAQATEWRQQLDAGLVAEETAAADMTSLLAAITAEQRAALNSLNSIDDDGDGLTNMEELWWCTDPLNPNSDGDANGYTDGEEVTALLDFTLPRNVRWGYGPPFGPPNAWPDWNGTDGNPDTPACNDGDWDTIPDYAEAYIIGSRTPDESTDNDKFDDGQELFGVTYCPGAPTNCGYGSYPAVEYWNFITAEMPDWVEPPGDNLFVAAFPVPEVSVVAGSWAVERVTIITTEEGQMTETTNSYATSITEGQSTSIADTVIWNEWEEVSEAVETPINVSAETTANAYIESAQECPPNNPNCKFWGGMKIAGGVLGIGATCLSSGVVTLGVGCYIGVVAGLAAIHDGLTEFNSDTIQNTTDSKKYIEGPMCSEQQSQPNDCYSSSKQDNAEVILNQKHEFQGVTNTLDGIQYAINQQGQLLARGLQDVSYAISQPRLTETHTNGRSWGGSQTTTHEVYEEHTITQGEAFTSGQNWSTAWAVDSSHAADLTFDYTIENTGTEYAREISGLIFNIYLGDDSTPIISYPAWEQFSDCALENVFPGDSHTFSSNPVPLTLEQMRRIDLGEKLTVVKEDYSYGADELFYQDAVNGGVTAYIEDGVADGDELVDMYVIPTWGVETVQDVLTRYFPAGIDDENNINSLWTPEFDGTNPPTWNEHFLSDIAWWNIYLTQNDAGNMPLHELPAAAGSALLFRFNRDSDRDGYQDRVEARYNTDKDDPASHPYPEILAGYTATQDGDEVTILLKLSNSGTFDAYGIDAVMYAPDDTVTIGNNTVGGNGRVRPGSQIAVGSLILDPNLDNWSTSTADPYAAGNFSGNTDKTITFTVSYPGTVGSGSAALDWTDGTTSDTLDLGSSYHAPLPIAVTEGIYVGFDTGTLANGDSFTIDTLTPRDTFTYTINTTPYTPPVIVVSYSDPQGSHRFVTPVELTGLDEDLTAYSGQMLPDVGVSIVASDTVDAVGLNTTNFIINSPHPEPLENAHLYLNFVADGELVAEMPYTMTLPTGPTVIPLQWSTDTFSQTYDAAADNILIAFWTDAQNNIIDSAARPLNTFQHDPTAAANIAPTTWDFGTLTQGEMAQTQIAVANSGFSNLLGGIVINGDGLTAASAGNHTVSPATFHELELTLDTTQVPAGPYAGTVTIRTSDIDAPQTVINVTGTIAPLAGDAVAYGTSPNEPLTEYLHIFSPHAFYEDILYEDRISVDPISTHPLVVLGGDNYEQYLGIGRELGLAGMTLDFFVSNVNPVLEANNTQPLWWNADYQYRRQITLAGNLPAATTIKFNLLDFSQLESEGKVRADKYDLRIVRFDGTTNTWQELARNYITHWEVDFKLATQLNGTDTSYWLYYGNPNASSPPTFATAPQGWWVDMYHDKWWSDFGGTWFFNQTMDFNDVCSFPLDHDGRIGSAFDESDKFRSRLFIPSTGNWTFSAYTNDGYRLYLDGVQVGGFDGYDGNRWATFGTIFLKAGWYQMDLRNMWVNCGAWKFAMQGPGFGNQIVPTSYFQALWEGRPSSISVSEEFSAFIIEKLSDTDHSIQMFSPENIANETTYKIQYGQKRSFSTGSTQVFTIELPKKTYDTVTIDSICVNMGLSNFVFAMDFGGDGSAEWSGNSMQHPAIFNSPNVAAGINAYLATTPDAWGDPVSIPIQVTLDTSGDVFLTNLSATSGSNADAEAGVISFSDSSPTEGETITIQAVVSNTAALPINNIVAAFFAGNPEQEGVYLGADFIPEIQAGGTAMATLNWDTSNLAGDVDLYVVLDLAGQVAEMDEDNNVSIQPLTVLSRPDLRAASWMLADSEPLAGETVTITANMLNNGQTASEAATHTLYNGNPNNGGILLDSQIDGGLGSNGSDAVAFSWLPTMPGPYQLFLRLDENDTVNEFDEANNLLWQDVYVGLAGPVLLDSGVTVSDPAYSSTVGYGYVDTGTPDVLLNCGGSDPEDTLRRDPDGSVNYRFNHLQPGHFYHLDITLNECDGAGRQENILVDGYLLAGPEDLGDGEVHKLSLRLDPALYADRMIDVSITAPGIDGAVVAAVNLHDVDYRYADAGGNADPEYDNNSDYGWLEGVANTAWGTLPYQSVRVDQNDNQVSYRFDNLDPTKRYNVWLTFWQGSGAARIQKVRIDGLEIGVTVDSGDFLQHEEKISVPLGSYASDGSIVVSIIRLNASSGAMVNEIALEEETLASAATCAVQTTPFFSQVYGTVALAGVSAPPGTVVQAFNPRGDIVGCFTVNNGGLYGFMRVYGEDNTANPPIPGMRAGELVSFKVSGSPAVATPLFYWQDDKASHQVNLNAAAMDAQFILLSPGWNWLSLNVEPPTPLVAQAFNSVDGRYDRVLGENGIYDVNLPPVFNSLTEIHAGLGYMLRITGTASVNLLAEGASIPPTTPIPLHQGWNWVGYLPAETLPITVALQSITGQYQLVLGQDGTFDPDLPQFSDLQEMSPGNGYMIYADTAVTLTYPASSQAGYTPQAAPMSHNPAQTPQFTMGYGEVRLNGVPASPGTIIEAVTPRGDVAGRFMVQRSGLYGFMRIYGEDETAVPLIPGFRDDEEVAWRINGHDVESAAPMVWQNDWATHEIELNLLGYWLYLPFIQ